MTETDRGTTRLLKLRLRKIYFADWSAVYHMSSGFLLKTRYKEKIDFQELIFAIVNWPNLELYGAFVCIMHYLEQSAKS